MDSKKGLKDLLEVCKRAEFRETLTLIKKSNGIMDRKCAIALIVGCCNSCVTHMPSPEKVSEEDLFVLLEFLNSFLTDLSETELMSYLQSIFFILKLLLKKKCYETIAKLEEMLVPQFIPATLTKKHSDTYQSSASLLHNLITRAGTEKVKYNQDYLKISLIAATIYSKVSNVSGLLSASYNCAISLFNLEAPTNDLQRHFFHVLNLVELTTIVREEDFKPFLSHFILVFNRLLREFNFETGAEFYKTVFKSASSIFEKDYINVLALLKLPLLLLPASFTSGDVIECKRALKELKAKSTRRVVENKINPLLYSVVYSYYKSVNGKKWCDISEDNQFEILQLIYSVAEIEAGSKFACPCNCSLNTNVYQGFLYSQYICILIELSVNHGDKITSKWHEKTSKLLTKFCDSVETLKGNKCDKWKPAWTSLGTSMYNIAVHLYQKSNLACHAYFHALIKNFIKFEHRTGTTILKTSMISSAFTAICALSAKDHKKCMAYTALAILLCPEQRDALLTSWVKTKVAQRDLKTPESEAAQKITIASAFDKFAGELAGLAGDAGDLISERDKVELLRVELEQYKKRWKSKVPMMMALKELCEVADVQTSVEVIVQIFGDCELNLHEDVPKILRKVLKMYEKSDSKSAIPLAVLYFLHYKYRVKDTISKNADDMERSMSCAPPSSDPPDAIPRDPTEECDIVSSYESLRLDKYSCVMKHLNNSLTLFSSVITDDFDPKHVETIPNSMVYDLLIKISFEYRLHCHRIRCLQALQMALKLARRDKDPCRIVESCGFIIEHGNIEKDFVKELVSVADKYLEDIAGTNLRVVLIYYICKAKAYLYHDYKEAYRIFEMASKLFESREVEDQRDLIKCQLLMLHYKFVLMPCSYKVVDHKKSTLITIHSANTAIFEAYNNAKIGSAYEMSILLEANDELAKLYHNLRSPREVRAYCRETVILAQKLVLPFRCATYLVYLAHADLRSTRYEDCQVKLDGLADILCLAKHSVPAEDDIEMAPCGGLDKEVETITNDLQEMVLDLPVPSHYKRQFSPSSPTLVIQPFYLPSFVKHQSCDCFCCVCYEYQELVLEKIRLDALINIKQDNHSVANDFFLGAIELYECYVRKYKSYKKAVSQLVACDLIPEFERVFLQAYGSVLLNYSYHLARGKNKVEALNVTDKLIELVTPRKVELVYLYSEVLVQKLGYLTDVPDITVSNDVDLDAEDCAAAESLDIPKTPETKHSKVTLPTLYSPNLSPPKRPPKKCLKFNLSPDDDGGGDASKKHKKPSPIAKRAPKTPAPYDLALKPKTPVPTIQIFTDKRSTRKKNLASTSKLGPASSVDAATPTVLLTSKNDAVLKSRTKLLTEKLRQSSKKADDDEPSGRNGGQSERKKSSVRKNLLSELGAQEETQSVGQGAVRRSTRPRKL